jgi:hypothetical protein
MFEPGALYFLCRFQRPETVARLGVLSPRKFREKLCEGGPDLQRCHIGMYVDIANTRRLSGNRYERNGMVERIRLSAEAAELLKK